MFDSHAHYDDKAFDECRDALIASLFSESGVKGFLNAGCDVASSLASLALAEKYENVFASVGIHPQEASRFTDADLASVCKLAEKKKAVAIGEIGLDYHYGTDDKEKQKELFVRQLDIAREKDLPVIIHQRDSVADCLEIVLSYDGITGVFHSFSGSAETAKLLLARGWYISFSGTVTFKNARQPVENALFVPDDRLLCETDCPYLTPTPFRGKRNDSGYMRLTVQKLAEIRGTSFEHIEKITADNAKRLFRIAD